jgi:alpha-L-fucosidase 2
MLLQSHDQVIAFFPALPKDWKNVSMMGIRARGGLEIDLSWKDGAPAIVKIHALRAGEHSFRAPIGYRIVAVKNQARKNVSFPKTEQKDPSAVTFPLTAGTSYLFEFAKA